MTSSGALRPVQISKASCALADEDLQPVDHPAAAAVGLRQQRRAAVPVDQVDHQCVLPEFIGLGRAVP